MPARLDYYGAAPEGLRAVRALDQYVRKSGLEPDLIEFVKPRASLMNGLRADMTDEDAAALPQLPSLTLALSTRTTVTGQLNGTSPVDHLAGAHLRHEVAQSFRREQVSHGRLGAPQRRRTGAERSGRSGLPWVSTMKSVGL
jgi:hypothetical protein